MEKSYSEYSYVLADHDEDAAFGIVGSKVAALRLDRGKWKACRKYIDRYLGRHRTDIVDEVTPQGHRERLLPYGIGHRIASFLYAAHAADCQCSTSYLTSVACHWFDESTVADCKEELDLSSAPSAPTGDDPVGSLRHPESAAPDGCVERGDGELDAQASEEEEAEEEFRSTTECIHSLLRQERFTSYAVEVGTVGEVVRLRAYRDWPACAGDPDCWEEAELSEAQWRIIEPHAAALRPQEEEDISPVPASVGARSRRFRWFAGNALQGMMSLLPLLGDPEDLDVTARNWFEKDASGSPAAVQEENRKLVLAPLRLNRRVWDSYGFAHGPGVLMLDPGIDMPLTRMVLCARMPASRVIKHDGHRFNARWERVRTAGNWTLGLMLSEQVEDGTVPREGIGLYVSTTPVSCIDGLIIPKELQVAALQGLLGHFSKKLGARYPADLDAVRAELTRVARLLYGKKVVLEKKRKRAAKPRRRKS